MDALLEKTLIASLERLAQGEPVETILADYPEQAAALRPHLMTASGLQALATQPTVGAKRASQDRFLAAAAALETAPPAPVPWWVRLRTVLTAAAAVAMLLVLLGSGLVIGSRNAIPGDSLYGLKRTIENYQLSSADDPDTLLALSERFEQERREEVQALLAAGRVEQVRFSGTIERIEDDLWTVAGLPVRIVPATVLDGEPQVGKTAEVSGRTTAGAVTADTIVIPEVPGPLPDPTPEFVQEPTPTPRPTLTSTPEPTATPSPTVTPTFSPTVAPTATPLPPSPTPDLDLVLPPGGGDDNANDGTIPPTEPGNDNGGDDNSEDGAGGDDSGNDHSDDQSNDNEDDGSDDSDSGNSGSDGSGSDGENENEGEEDDHDSDSDDESAGGDNDDSDNRDDGNDNDSDDDGNDNGGDDNDDDDKGD